jgi:hypothetical protein
MQGRQKRNAGALALWSCLFACGPDLVASDGGTSDDGTSDEGTSDDGGEPVVFPNMRGATTPGSCRPSQSSYPCR